MKTKKPKPDPMILHDRAEPLLASSEESMVRTQIYLTRAEQEFLQAEAGRKGLPMSAIIRGIIDEKMRVPADAWASNPLLEPTPEIEGWEAPADGAINHDHYVYGGPRKHREQGGEWEMLPQLDS